MSSWIADSFIVEKKENERTLNEWIQCIDMSWRKLTKVSQEE